MCSKLVLQSRAARRCEWHQSKMRVAATAAATGALLAGVCAYLLCSFESPTSLYPEHMVDKVSQYGFGYGKPGIGYGPTVRNHA